MKKQIIIIMILILIILLIILLTIGVKNRQFEILSISEIKEKNKELEEVLDTATELCTVDYMKEVDNLEETYNKYNIQKQKYEEISGFADIDEKDVYETKKYDIGYLWKILGKYATTYNIGINMDVKNGSGVNLYNLSFSISGQYVNISQFIADIENNSDLYFRIYNFKMSGSDNLSASFLIKDVYIDPDTIITAPSNINNTVME